MSEQQCLSQDEEMQILVTSADRAQGASDRIRAVSLIDAIYRLLDDRVRDVKVLALQKRLGDRPVDRRRHRPDLRDRPRRPITRIP